MDSDSSDTGNDTIEIAKHAGLVNKVLNLQEKLGEVIAGLQFLLVAKSGEDVHQETAVGDPSDNQWLFGIIHWTMEQTTLC